MRLSHTKIDRRLSTAQRNMLCDLVLERSASPTGKDVEKGLFELKLWEAAGAPSGNSINEWLKKSLAFEIERRALKADAELARILAENAGEGLAQANMQLLDAELFAVLRARRSGEQIDPKSMVALAECAAMTARTVQQSQRTAADVALRDEQVAKLQREREEWAEKRRKVAEQVDRVRNAPAANADEVRSAAVAEIDRIMGLTR